MWYYLFSNVHTTDYDGSAPGRRPGSVRRHADGGRRARAGNSTPGPGDAAGAPARVAATAAAGSAVTAPAGGAAVVGPGRGDGATSGLGILRGLHSRERLRAAPAGPAGRPPASPPRVRDTPAPGGGHA